jgi:hypothetical protein
MWGFWLAKLKNCFLSGFLSLAIGSAVIHQGACGSMPEYGFPDAGHSACTGSIQSPSIDSFDSIDSIVMTPADIVLQATGYGVTVNCLIDYSFPGEVESDSQRNISLIQTSSDIYAGVHQFRFPGFYQLTATAKNECSSSIMQSRASVRAEGTDRIGKSLLDVYSHLTILQNASTSYDNWQQSFYPLLESIGITEETRSRLNAYQQKPNTTYSVIADSDKGFIVYEIVPQGYHGVNGTDRIYEALEITKSDIDLLIRMLT